jgi:hypothetical protein
MKHFAIAALASFGIVLAAVPAARADTNCTTTQTNGTINGNLVVPPSATCTLVGETVTGNAQVQTSATLIVEPSATKVSTIDGNVSVGQGATLEVEGGSIHGNIQADQCLFVALVSFTGAISVGGNLLIQHCTANSGLGAFFGNPITISGNFECQNNTALFPCAVEGASVGAICRPTTIPGLSRSRTIRSGAMCRSTTIPGTRTAPPP